LGLDFLNRTFRTTAALLLIFVPFGFYYLGFYQTLAILSGGIWGILNVLFITRLVQSTIRAEGAQTSRAVAFVLIKFPALYAAGYFLLKVPQFNPIHLLIGFSLLLAVMVLKVLGRLYLGLDNSVHKNEKLQKVH
jgi:hypothetical protein